MGIQEPFGIENIIYIYIYKARSAEQFRAHSFQTAEATGCVIV